MEIDYLNKKHKKLVDGYIGYVKEIVYYATEDSQKGKYNEYSALITTIIEYSNNFYKGVNPYNNTKEEFAFMIPNLIFYMSIGFLTGLQKKKTRVDTMMMIEKIADTTQGVTGEIAEILIKEERQDKREELFSDDLDPLKDMQNGNN